MRNSSVKINHGLTFKTNNRETYENITKEIANFPVISGGANARNQTIVINVVLLFFCYLVNMYDSEFESYFESIGQSFNSQSATILILFGVLIVSFLYRRKARKAYKLSRKIKKSHRYQEFLRLVQKLTDDVHECINEYLPTLCARLLLNDTKIERNEYFGEAMNEIFGQSVVSQIINSERNTEKKTKDHKSDKSRSNTRALLRELYESEDFVEISTALLAEEIAKSDGQISDDEIKVIREKFNLSELSQSIFIKVDRLTNSLELILKLLNKTYSDQDEIIETVINNLLYVAEADGHVSEDEISKLEQIATSLGMSLNKFRSILRNSQQLRSDENKRNRDFFTEEEHFDEIDHFLDDVLEP